MTELHRFTTVDGKGCVLDLSAMVSCWEGESEDTIVFIFLGQEDSPVIVHGRFERFVNDWLSYWDARQRKRARRLKQAPVISLATTKAQLDRPGK